MSKIGVKLAPLIGKLSILVIPFSSIYIDGILQRKDANVPYTIDLPTGTHLIKAIHPSFGKWQKRIVIEPNKLDSVLIDFNRIVTLSVTAFDFSEKPLVGEIYVDGQSNQYFTPKELRLRVGLHSIEVRREGYIGQEKIINLEDNLSEPLRFVLKKI